MVPETAQAREVIGGLQAALADRHRALRHPGHQFLGRTQVHGQGAQVPIVHANDLRPGVRRRLQLRSVVHLDEHIEAERRGAIRQRRQVLRRQGRDNQQHGVGAGGSGLEQLVFGDDKILPEDRHVHSRAHALEVLERAVEERRLCQHRDRRRAGGGVPACD